MNEKTHSSQSAPYRSPAPKPVVGKYCLADLLREIEVDAEDLSGGKMLDQERIHALFRNGSRDGDD